MAKNVAGDLQVATANRLRDGASVFLDPLGAWTTDFAAAAVFDDEEIATAALATAKSRAEAAVELVLIGVARTDAGIEPITLRERIRARGLTFEMRTGDGFVASGATR